MPWNIANLIKAFNSIKTHFFLTKDQIEKEIKEKTKVLEKLQEKATDFFHLYESDKEKSFIKWSSKSKELTEFICDKLYEKDIKRHLNTINRLIINKETLEENKKNFQKATKEEISKNIDDIDKIYNEHSIKRSKIIFKQ